MCDSVHGVQWHKIASLWQIQNIYSELPSVVAMFVNLTCKMWQIPHYYFAIGHGRLLSKADAPELCFNSIVDMEPFELKQHC